MSNTLYRKYRPQKFSDVFGQQHIVRTLSNSIKNKRVGHAYLFTGPRGTGKTTLARIFAKAVNCTNLSNKKQTADTTKTDNQNSQYHEPCLVCENCKTIQDGRSLDIIEIDAASNTGVDNIRELRETVKLPPAQSEYKVYIIDEAHMLSIGAFNALLKTLEEPPKHAIFILATTAVHKIPDTILSRCQRFDLARLPLENIVKKLSFIAKEEGIKIDKDSLQMIALAAEGGMRDAESLLSQVMALEDKNITSKEVEDILGTTQRQSVEDLAELLLEKNLSSALSLVNKLSEDGYDLEVLVKSLLNYFRQMMIISIDPDLAKNFSFELTGEQLKKLEKLSQKSALGGILDIINNLFECQSRMKSSFIPQLPLEMAIVKSIRPESEISKQNKNEDSREKSADPQPEKSSSSVVPSSGKNSVPISQLSDATEKNKDISKEIETKNSKAATEQVKDITLEDVKYNWNMFINAVKPYNHSLNALLSNCQPVKTEGNSVIIAAKYVFHKEKLNEHESRLTAEKVLGSILGSKVRIRAVSEEEAGIKIKTNNQQPKTGDKKEDNSLLSDALNIFGGRLIGDPPERRGK